MSRVDEIDAQIAPGRSLVPGHLWEGLRGHILQGTPTGRFLTAVCANDLLNAATGADDVSLANLPDIMRFMHNYAPGYSWGTSAVMNRWRAVGGVAGGAFDDVELKKLNEARP